MGNVLKMDKQNQIKALLDLGWSYRAIEREVAIRRETISKYDFRKQTDSKPAKVPTDNEPNAARRPPTSRSSAALFDNEIREALQKGHTAQRIYQDLVTDPEITVSYDAVKRYIRKLKKRSPKLYARIHSEPGEEAQVDFGQGALTLKNGKYRSPWLFKMTLSNSRHSYEEAVWHQDVETFIRCHEKAFQFFGGTVKTIRLDNLKSGVLKAHLFEPELNPVYLKFAEHYGFVPLPCLPRKPEHKGKVEAGIKYTQDNALKGRRFESLEEQNAFLKHWNRTWARTRIHGTVKKQVWEMFQAEKPYLKPLPDTEFDYFKIGFRTVHADGHIEVNKSYYSVPYLYLGKQVVIHFNSRWIKVFHKGNHQLELVAFHRTVHPGRFQTASNHLPQNKTFTTASYTKYLLDKCRNIGRDCVSWAETALRDREQLAFRSIQGVLSLAKKYPSGIVNRACGKALGLHSTRYHTVRLLCEDAENPVNDEQKLIQSHEIIRESGEYQQYLELFN